jgi:hypothetical protein
MKLVVNLFSLVLVIMALMLMGGDIITSLEHQGTITVRSIAEVWDLFEAGGAEAFKAWNAAHLPGFLAQAIAFVLGFWSWAVVGVLGVVLAFVFGRKHEAA